MYDNRYSKANSMKLNEIIDSVAKADKTALWVYRNIDGLPLGTIAELDSYFATIGVRRVTDSRDIREHNKETQLDEALDLHRFSNCNEVNKNGKEFVVEKDNVQMSVSIVNGSLSIGRYFYNLDVLSIRDFVDAKRSQSLRNQKDLRIKIEKRINPDSQEHIGLIESIDDKFYLADVHYTDPSAPDKFAFDYLVCFNSKFEKARSFFEPSSLYAESQIQGKELESRFGFFEDGKITLVSSSKTYFELTPADEPFLDYIYCNMTPEMRQMSSNEFFCSQLMSYFKEDLDFSDLQDKVLSDDASLQKAFRILDANDKMRFIAEIWGSDEQFDLRSQLIEARENHLVLATPAPDLKQTISEFSSRLNHSDKLHREEEESGRNQIKIDTKDLPMAEIEKVISASDYNKTLELCGRINEPIPTPSGEYFLVQKDGENLIAVDLSSAKEAIQSFVADEKIKAEGIEFYIGEDNLRSIASGTGQWLKPVNGGDPAYIVFDLKSKRPVRAESYESVARRVARDASRAREEKQGMGLYPKESKEKNGPSRGI